MRCVVSTGDLRRGFSKQKKSGLALISSCTHLAVHLGLVPAKEGQVKQVLEDKEALVARLHRSPDLLDALLMTFTFSHQG